MNMKKSNLIILSFAFLMVFVSCTEKVIIQEGIETGEAKVLTFTASNAEMDNNPNSRTLVREGGNVYWVANDRISLFSNGSNNPFITKDGGLVTNFKGEVSQTSDIYYALYPYNAEASISGNTITTTLYHEQYAEPDSYASGMNISVSISGNSDAQDLGFKHAVSYLAVHISSEYVGDDIKYMELSGNADEMLAGEVTITITGNDEVARIIEGKGQPIISLKQINANSIMMPGKSYYFVFAPQTFSQGYTLKLYNGKGGVCSIKQEEPIVFERNVIEHITIENATFEKEDKCEVREDGYHVKSLACLQEWAYLVANGDTDLNCYIEADIDFNSDDLETSWPVIGTLAKPYTGTISGGGFTIKNFKIDDSRQYAGFIGVLGVNGAITNLTFESPVVKTSYVGTVGNVSDDGYAGSLVGMLNRSSMNNYTSAAITNCHVINPTVSGGENVGGIVGRSYGRNDAIKGCTVSGGTIEGKMFVGGIVGNSEGIVEDCHVKNNTEISYENTQSEARVGGIVGTNNSGELVACTAQAKVVGDANNGGYDARYAGGVTGANNGTMVGCAFSGIVTGDYSGALAGESYGDMYGCYAQQATAQALIYKVKRNLNNASDVVFPTFKACYWVGDEGDVVFGSADVEEYATIVDCSVVSRIENVTATMNNALTEVNNNTEYAYGSGYQYQTNEGENATAFPVKATKPQ